MLVKRKSYLQSYENIYGLVGVQGLEIIECSAAKNMGVFTMLVISEGSYPRRGF